MKDKNQSRCLAFEMWRRAARGGVVMWAIMLALTVIMGQLASAQTFTVLYTFTGWLKGGGSNPEAGVIRDAEGNLYVTTNHDGPYEPYGGTVYKLDARGNATQLYAFCAITGCADGAEPSSSLLRDKKGNLYGTTFGEGGTCCTGSTVFKLTPGGKEKVLYTFTGGADGGGPVAGLVRDAEGNFYGTTAYGGNAQGYPGDGTIFKLTPKGKETVLYTFTGGADGYQPYMGVIRDSSGNLYGTTMSGGNNGGQGTVYMLSPKGKLTVLHTFTGGADGASPGGGWLLRDAKGNLYGTTGFGGGTGNGVVFKVTPKGKETVLYSFAGGSDGATPQGGLVRDAKGNLYGTTTNGGAAGAGTVFKLSPKGKETVLHSFDGSAGGALPAWPMLVLDASGNLYGTTMDGGDDTKPFGDGIVFKLTP